MIFSSIFFLFVFLPVTLILYYLVPWKGKNLVLLLTSLVFYAWGEPVYVALMLFSIVFNYLSGIELTVYEETNQNSKKKFCFWMTVAVNLGVLGFFKYYGFLIGNLNAILPFHIPYRALPLPIGISFYTFQTLSYIIDVYKGKVEVQKNFVRFGAYVTMFPQLIAGPIVRYSDVEKQLRKRSLSIYKFGQGTTWFLRGLGKKVLLANNVGVLFDTIAALEAGQRSVLTAWLGLIAYALQVYFDFSGYSDMAVGLGKMFGFEFMKNFDYPYTSASVSEFWRRWHISLGSWFREYVYIPLGGNRVSVPMQIRNLLIVWMLTGFWHGADWNFILWGLYYGIWLIIEKFITGRYLKRLPIWLSRLITLFIVLLGWVWFFSPDFSSAVVYFGNLAGISGAGLVDARAWYYLKTNGLLLLIGMVGSTQLPWDIYMGAIRKNSPLLTVKACVGYGLILLLSAAYLVNATYNPFLYFRF